MTMRFIEKFVDGLSSIWLSCTLLTLLGLLTWLGTLEQVNTGLFEVQRKYFDSIFLIHKAGPIAIPLPGAALASCASGGMSPNKSTASEMTSTSAPCGTVNSPRWRREPRCVAPGGLAG